MFGLFESNKPVLDEPSVAWLFDTYAWAMEEFGAEIFFQDAVLVEANDQFFPGDADTAHGVAQLIFNKVLEYGGMSHWPVYIFEPGGVRPAFQPKVEMHPPLRGKGLPAPAAGSAKLGLTYDPQFLGKPETLIATFAYQLSQQLYVMADTPAPGGEENWPFTCEVLSIFMGFGLPFVNNAYAPRNQTCGSGSCGSGDVGWKANLGQYDLTYALAMFVVLKGLPERKVAGLVKGTLRTYFKKAVKDVRSRTSAVDALHAFEALPAP